MTYQITLTTSMSSYLCTVCHATMNAIVWANKHDVRDCIIYTTNFPCNKCAQLIVQSRINKVYYMTENQCGLNLHQPTSTNSPSHIILNNAEITPK